MHVTCSVKIIEDSVPYKTGVFYIVSILFSMDAFFMRDTSCLSLEED